MAGSGRSLRSLIHEIDDMINSTTAGLDAKISPERTKPGLRGSYYMHDESGNCVAVFKPLDEEPNAVKKPQQQQSKEGNKEEPRGSFVEGTPEGLKKGTKAGKGGYRETAAYLLDHPISGRRSDSHPPTTFGFAGVPPTTFGSCLSVYFKNSEGAVTEKFGSLQMYMENNGDCAEAKIGSEYVSFTVDEVHKIAVLDMRLANADRHGGNILRSKSLPVKLIPIDHGYCLTDSFEAMKFVWLAWPQAKEPFSPETIEYIKTLDAEEDICLLKSYGFVMPLPIAGIFRVSTMLLKKGAAKDLTPYTIGDIMCRDNPDKKSPVKKKSVIEEIVQEALNLSEEDNDKFLEVVSVEMDLRLGEIAIA